MASTTDQAVQTFEFTKDELIEAPINIVFESLLDELGPESVMMDGKPMPLKLEAFPGGRWFRDLGNNSGHLWGHVQVIKPPGLLEIWGPMMMSYPVTNHVQYRLTAEGSQTRIKLTHRAVGLIPPDHRSGMPEGWTFKLNRVKQLAARRHSK